MCGAAAGTTQQSEAHEQPATEPSMLRVTVDAATSLFEAAGILAMALGALLALALTFRDRGGGGRAAFQGFRSRLGRAIILGLEFLVAADILRTISSRPTLGEVAVLGGIVLIRTLLTFSMEVELEGHWPWQPQVVDREPKKNPPARSLGQETP
jgi:uncharacterized membrane protein